MISEHCHGKDKKKNYRYGFERVETTARPQRLLIRYKIKKTMTQYDHKFCIENTKKKPIVKLFSCFLTRMQ